MHPFREGNGRCQREVILALAMEKGFELYLDVNNDDDVYNRYMDGTVNSNAKILKELFMEILSEDSE
jgi:cell filamentation protein